MTKPPPALRRQGLCFARESSLRRHAYDRYDDYADERAGLNAEGRQPSHWSFAKPNRRRRFRQSAVSRHADTYVTNVSRLRMNGRFCVALGLAVELRIVLVFVVVAL